MKNPVIKGWYADPESRVYNGKVYMYVTRSLPFEDQHNLDLVVTDDLKTFTKIESILDMSTFKGATFAIWAPTIIDKDGKYYLIFAANDIHEDNEPGGLYIGVCDKPEGPFVNVFADGRPLLNVFHYGAQPIDAHLFKDDDGSIYLYYGGWKHLVGCKMNETMDGFVDIDVVGAKDNKFIELTPDTYVEAPYVRKMGGKYHLLYSTGGWTNGTYCVKAGVADSPLSSFTYYDDILKADNLADGPGHNSAFTFNGVDYVAYHRRRIGDKYPHNRELCIDEISVEGDKFHPVKMT